MSRKKLFAALSYPTIFAAVEKPRHDALNELLRKSWSEVHSDAHFKSLKDLVRAAASKPLLIVRCLNDGELCAGVWQTSRGALLVTAADYNGTAGPQSGLWYPGLMLLDVDADGGERDPFPVRCSRCNRPTALHGAKVRESLADARAGGPRVVKA